MALTFIQVLALVGVFLIGAIMGVWAFVKLVGVGLRRTTLLEIFTSRCDDPECDARHVTLTVETMLGPQTLTVLAAPTLKLPRVEVPSDV